MAYVIDNMGVCENDMVVYLTRLAKDRITKLPEDGSLNISYFSFADNNINYKIENTIERVPDLAGENDDCLDKISECIDSVSTIKRNNLNCFNLDELFEFVNNNNLKKDVIFENGQFNLNVDSDNLDFSGFVIWENGVENNPAVNGSGLSLQYGYSSIQEFIYDFRKKINRYGFFIWDCESRVKGCCDFNEGDVSCDGDDGDGVSSCDTGFNDSSGQSFDTYKIPEIEDSGIVVVDYDLGLFSDEIILSSTDIDSSINTIFNGSGIGSFSYFYDKNTDSGNLAVVVTPQTPDDNTDFSVRVHCPIPRTEEAFNQCGETIIVPTSSNKSSQVYIISGGTGTTAFNIDFDINTNDISDSFLIGLTHNNSLVNVSNNGFFSNSNGFLKYTYVYNPSLNNFQDYLVLIVRKIADRSIIQGDVTLTINCTELPPQEIPQDITQIIQ